MTARCYLDNAATTFPKPPEVISAVADYMTTIGASAGRGAYRAAMQSRAMLDRTRDLVRRLFSASDADDVIFTLNGSDALNLALKGVLRPGDHALTTVMDHNSVLRPLSALSQRGGVSWDAVQADAQTTLVSAADVAAALRPNTRLVALNHASNVTGALQPLDEIAALCRARGVLLLLDAAQTAGHVPIDLARTPVDLLACPGHKGLLGPLGVGLLVIRAGLAQDMVTLREGGTGSASELPVQPESTPDKFEAGSHNAPGIAGLEAALRWILERGVAGLRDHEQRLTRQMLSALQRLPQVRCFGPRDASQRVGVFSVLLDGLDPHELAGILEGQFGVLSRAGLHCAPLAHQTLGTLESGGTARMSLGPFTSAADVELVSGALQRIARGAAAAV